MDVKCRVFPSACSKFPNHLSLSDQFLHLERRSSANMWKGELLLPWEQWWMAFAALRAWPTSLHVPWGQARIPLTSRDVTGSWGETTKDCPCHAELVSALMSGQNWILLSTEQMDLQIGNEPEDALERSWGSDSLRGCIKSKTGTEGYRCWGIASLREIYGWLNLSYCCCWKLPFP